jgi:hypothetical protein
MRLREVLSLGRVVGSATCAERGSVAASLLRKAGLSEADVSVPVCSSLIVDATLEKKNNEPPG